MDSDTLNTASAYLNNLLLARGLLRNGKSLDFAKPTRETRAQVINLVHDLLLRRDRDEETREQIALTMRTLRTDETRKDAEIARFKVRVEEKERALLQAEAETRNMKMEMRRVESSMKSLQDQLARLKASVGHIKTQCANDVRKRDVHIERLKTHLQGQQRGNKRGVVAPMISITGGSGSASRFHASVRDLQDPEYSLKQETTEFLTQLGQSLSDENDGLITMLQGTLQTMKELLGLETNSSNVNTRNGEQDTTIIYDIDAAPLSYDSLMVELESTLEVLNSVLTSPNFVSMEEVESRDEEIMRLREGWEKMETRWKEVVSMMHTWRTKMEKEGDTINLDDLKRGLGLGEGLNTSPHMTGTSTDSSFNSRPDDQADIVEDAQMASFRQDSGTGDQGLTIQDQRSIALDPPELFHQKPAKDRHLRWMSPNIQSHRKVAFTENVAKSSPSLLKADPSPVSAASKGGERNVRSSSQRERKDIFADSSDLLHQPPPISTEEEQGQLTIAEKLRAAQVEAEQAMSTRAPEDLQKVESSQLDLELNAEMENIRSPAKKSKIKGRPKRRKSTLSPEELESLLGLE